MDSLKKTLVACAVVGLLVTPPPAKSITYYIVDPSRDFSWYMREFRRELMVAWRIAEKQSQEILKHGLALAEMYNDSAAESEKVAKVTESVSETANAASEERYSPLSAVCGAINLTKKISKFVGSFNDTCKIADQVNKVRVNELNNNLNNINKGHTVVRTITSPNASDQENSEKFLQHVADMQYAFDRMSNQSELLNETDAKLAQQALDILFSDNQLKYEQHTIPSVDGFQAYVKKKAVEYQLESYLHERIERRLAAYSTAFDSTSNPELMRSMAQQESGGQTGLTSHAGAEGLMQFMPATAKERNLDPNDPIASIREADKYMTEIGNYVGTEDIRWQLAGYNWGMGNAKKLHEQHNGNFETAFNHLPQETKDYVVNITNSYNERLTNNGKPNEVFSGSVSQGQVAISRSYLLKGSPASTQKYIEDMRNELMSPALWRHIAMMKAAQLAQDYAYLTMLSDQNVNLAQRLKNKER